MLKKVLLWREVSDRYYHTRIIIYGVVLLTVLTGKINEIKTIEEEDFV
jgi:hypothetical protein